MIPRVGGLLAAVLVLAGFVAPPAAAAVAADDRYAVGDSVMLGARSNLKKAGFGVDATESRQAYTGPALLRKKGARLPTNVVVHLGTNGTYPLDTCKRLVRAAGPDRRVFLVTVHVPRSWQRPNNAVIRRCAASFEDGRVTVVDWDALVRRHPAWLYSDRIHLKPAGAAGFARMIDGAVDDAVARARTEALANAAGTGKAGLIP